MSQDETQAGSELSAGLGLDGIKARVALATPGPWYAAKASSPVWTEDIDYIRRAEDDCILDEKKREILGSSEWIRVRWEDLEFMAHAREDVGKLIAEVERLRAMVEP